MKAPWTETYRPKTLADYVFTDPEQKTLIETWIRDQYIPDILLSGSAGTGKTTLAKVIINELGVADYDVLLANGSKEARKIEWVTDTLEPFCQTMPFGNIKVVLIDEADYMNINSVQPALRNLIENYSSSVRFILTCNYPNKIMAALQSRCEQGRIHIDKPDVTEFTARAATVLVTENVEFDLDTLDSYVKATYPDLRRCLHMIQKKSVTGVLTTAATGDNLDVSDWKLDAVTMFKAGRITEGRKIICSQAALDNMDEIYRWMYDNLSVWSDTQEGQDQAILTIRKALTYVPLVVDQEINLSACLIELTQKG